MFTPGLLERGSLPIVIALKPWSMVGTQRN